MKEGKKIFVFYWNDPNGIWNQYYVRSYLISTKLYILPRSLFLFFSIIVIFTFHKRKHTPYWIAPMAEITASYCFSFSLFLSSDPFPFPYNESDFCYCSFEMQFQFNLLICIHYTQYGLLFFASSSSSFLFCYCLFVYCWCSLCYSIPYIPFSSSLENWIFIFVLLIFSGR